MSDQTTTGTRAPRRAALERRTSESTVSVEIDLSAEHQVSRMTVREAVRTLGAQHILRVERGRGTFVNPVSQWASLDAVIRAVSEGRTTRRPPCS